MKLSHELFSEALIKLHLLIYEGVCQGYQMMWVQHMCGNRENEFFSFLSKIAEYPDLETLVRSLNSRNNIKLTNFFEEIAHYQNPDNYSEVLYLGENNQQIELISEQLSSRLPSSELIEQVPIKSIYQKSFILCRVELGYYLNELIKKLNLLVGVPIAILLSNDIHTIGIKWDSISGLWSNSDINLIGDDNYLKPTYNTPEITELIFDSLFDTEGEYAGFTINIVMNKMDYAQNSELSNFFTSFVVTLPDYAVQSRRKNARKIDLLYIAVSTLCLDDVNNLLSHGGVNPNSLNNSGLSPLNIACIKGAFKLVQALIAHPDIDPNIRDADGYSVLDGACLRGDVAMVNELLTHKSIDINKCNPIDQTPLHTACALNNTAIVNVLLSHKDILPHKRNNEGISPLDLAFGNTEIRYAIQAYDLRIIQKAVDTAQKKYSQWYNGANHRGANGFFSWLRHGSAGQHNAFLMNQTISNSMRYDEAKLIINKFLIDESKTRYHRHSFASFLLDELNQIEDSPWANVICDSGSKLYNKRDVIIKLSPFVHDYKVELSTFFI